MLHLRTFIAAGFLLCAGAVPVIAEEEEGACSVADIKNAVDEDLTCSTDGTVFFGDDVTQFVLSQCEALSIPDQSSSALKGAQAACVRCAVKSAEAFKAAAKAGLIKPNKVKINEGKIRQLCKSTNDGEEGEGDVGEPPPSDAVQSLLEQIRLCFPQPGSNAEPAQCIECGVGVLDSALSSEVINQAKYDVLKRSVQQACSGQGGGEKPGRPGGPGATPSPTPPPLEGGEDMKEFFDGVRTCLGQFRGKPADCAACVNAVPTEGLDAGKVSEALNSARQACSGSFGPPPPPPM